MNNKSVNNINFKMYMEGVNVPFYGAVITATPNGVEAQVSVYSTRELFNLKPKTAVQIFYQDWVDGIGSWRLMFDGFTSAIVKSDTDIGVNSSLVCRDFRMDMRRMPAAMAWQSKSHQLDIEHLYSSAGLFHNWTIKGIDGKETIAAKTRTFGKTVLNSLPSLMKRVASSARGGGAVRDAETGEYALKKSYGDAIKKSPSGYADCGLFLDSIIRGVWLEAAGGTSMGYLLNKRIRVDKRIIVPVNKAGYDFWTKANAGIQGGSYLMGNSTFSSVESAIMRFAGLFSTRVFSCSTPTLIPIGKETDATKWVIASDVRDFLVNRNSANFGGKYLLNETMLLPPLEFTAPPNCNIFLPPVCTRIQWTYDKDVDATRGNFTTINSISTPSSSKLARYKIQIPTVLFDRASKDKNSSISNSNKLLTLDERYSGVNVITGTVEYNLAADDVKSVVLNKSLKKKAAEDNGEKINELKADIAEVENNKTGIPGLSNSILDKYKAKLKKLVAKRNKAKVKLKAKLGSAIRKSTTTALQRHAALKFLNRKYTGRVVTVDMSFNPYVMCGFPGMIPADPNTFGNESGSTIVGSVQQVQHRIIISNQSAHAVTSIVMNGARFVTEPTEIDEMGDPLFMKATKPKLAEIDPETLKYKSKEDYFVPDPIAPIKHGSRNSAYDFSVSLKSDKYVYAKDLLTLTSKDIASSKINALYIDSNYEPNRIAAFYKYVLQQNTTSFMVGDSSIVENGVSKNIKFMYDTIHEASEELRKSDVMYDYISAMKFASREICTADAFYQGILGLSVRNGSGDDVVYENITEGFDGTRLDEEYFGVTTDMWENDSNIKKLKHNSLSVDTSGTMTGPGEYSSILESDPVTAFIQERKVAVEKYRKRLNQVILSEGYPNVK